MSEDILDSEKKEIYIKCNLTLFLASETEV